MKSFIILVALAGLFVAGCSQQNMDPFVKFMGSASDLAKTGNITGTLRGRLGEGFEAGLKESVYLVNPGSYLEIDFTYRFAEADNVTD